MIENELITKVLQHGSVTEVIEGRITCDYFSAHGEVFNLILDHFNQHGVIPNRGTITRFFPNFPFEESVPEPIGFYIDQLRKKHKYGLIAEAMQNAGRVIGEDVDEAMGFIEVGLRRVYQDIGVIADREWTQGTAERLADYDSRRSTMGLLGAETPWEWLTDKTLGWQDGHLVTLVGRPKTGKSWFMVMCAVYSVYAEMRTVLFVSMEMSVGEILRRADALYAGLGYKDFRRGRMNDVDREHYEQTLSEIARAEGKLVVVGALDAGAAAGVTFLESKIRQYNPSVVIVDGVYLMYDEQRGRTKTDQLYNITRDLKRVAQNFEVPILISTQMGRSNRVKESAGGAKGVQWADSFAQDSDVLIEIFQDGEMKDNNEMQVILQTQREGEANVARKVAWNFETMNFGFRLPSQRRIDYQERTEETIG